MTILKLVKETSVTGEETFTIIDQDRVQVGPTYKNEFDANKAFERSQSHIEKFGNLKKSEIVKEFIEQPKT